MTLIPLDRKNFVNNSVEVNPAVDYIFTSNMFNNFKEIKDIKLTTSGTIGGIRSIGTYSPRIKEVNKYFLGDNHPNNINIGLLNEHLSEENVEGYLTSSNELDVLCRNTWQFGIDRFQQRYLYSDDFLDKKLTIKNNLYKDYSSHKNVKDYIENLNWSFTNYNCINFFTIGKGDENKTGFVDNVTHTNGIVYPNFGKEYSFSNNIFVSPDELSLCFWINPRYKQPAGQIRNNGCIFNIPYICNAYLIGGTELDLEDREETFRIGLTFANKTIANIDLSLIDLESNTNQINNASIVTKDCLKFNNWHHVTIKLKNYLKNISAIPTAVNYRPFIAGEILVDNYSIYSFDTSSTGQAIEWATNLSLTGGSPYIDNSFICIGNKISLSTEKEARISKIRNIFTSDGSGNSPGENKFLNEKTTHNLPTDAWQNPTTALFVKDRNTSEALEAEIHDIRIYNTSLSQEKINNVRGNGVKNIEAEKELGLIFYVPVYFIPDNLRKKTYINAAISENDRVVNTCFNFVTNPYYFNNCGGHQVSYELFTLEWIKGIRPNVIIGNRINNDYSDDFIQGRTDTTNISNDAWNFSKIGVPYHEIYLSQSLNSGSPEPQQWSHIYNNNLIMPCDNGLQAQNFDIIKSNFSSGIVTSSYVFDTKNGYFDYSQVFMENSFVQDILSDDYPLSKISIKENTPNFFKPDIITYERLADYKFTIGGSEKQINKLHRDKLFNMSNLQYHDKEVHHDWFREARSGVYSIFFGSHLDSNPVTRNYSSAKIDQTGNILGEKDIFDNSYEAVNIQKIFPLYKSTQDPVEFHSIFFNISNQLYNRKIKKETFSIKDYDLFGTSNAISINLKESGKGKLYRADSFTRHATWNHVGHIFYSEGICTILHPSLYNFGKTNFRVKFLGENAIYTNEINIPVEAGFHNRSHNSSYISDLVASESAYETNHKFVYVTDINLHDENLNIVARAKLAQPVVKRETDNIVFRLKMDY